MLHLQSHYAVWVALQTSLEQEEVEDVVRSVGRPATNGQHTVDEHTYTRALHPTSRRVYLVA